MFIEKAKVFDETAYMDANRFKQIIINLVSNAIKYTQEGHVKIGGFMDVNLKVAKVIVEDSGVGMT